MAVFNTVVGPASDLLSLTLQNAASWDGYLSKVALAGESAGGNLAFATTIYARDNKLIKPVHVDGPDMFAV